MKISEVASGPWLEYSMYTLENRAIPSMIDGLKPVQRFIMYSALQNANTKFLKVAALAGFVSPAGYHHGEQNAQGAAMLMAAEWRNNQPLLLGDGNFGNRLINEGAAARYVYAKVHPNFHNIYSDFDLCPAHEDEEHLPPKYYLPSIPMVLVNGIKGIATGFATDILPYSIADIKRLCLMYASGKSIDSETLVPSFPGFKGSIEANPKGGWDLIGTFERQGATGLTITEIPYEFDREAYIQILDELEEKQVIVRYDDKSDKSGFKFQVTLKRGFNGDIIKLFKLRRGVSENITVLDENGKLRQYKSPIQLIKDFVDFRIAYIQKRIDSQLAKCKVAAELAEARVKFIDMVLDDKIIFKGKSKAQITEELTGHFKAEYIDKLIGMNFYSLTSDERARQVDLANQAKDELIKWENQTPINEYTKVDLVKLKNTK